MGKGDDGDDGLHQGDGECSCITSGLLLCGNPAEYSVLAAPTTLLRRVKKRPGQKAFLTSSWRAWRGRRWPSHAGVGGPPCPATPWCLRGSACTGKFCRRKGIRSVKWKDCSSVTRVLHFYVQLFACDFPPIIYFLEMLDIVLFFKFAIFTMS